MSNPELSENKTNDAYAKKAKNRPVPKFMSMTWLRVHMKKIIIAVIATLVWAFKKDKEMMEKFAEAEGLDYDGMSLKQKLL